MESEVLKRFKDDVMSRQEIAALMNLDIRTLQRYIAARSIRFVRTHFLEDVKGRIYFSKRRIHESFDLEDKEALASWREENIRQKMLELDESIFALEIRKLGIEISKLIDRDDDESLAKADEVSEQFFEMKNELEEKQEARLHEFFSEGLKKKEEGQLDPDEWVKVESFGVNSAEKNRYERRQK